MNDIARRTSTTLGLHHVDVFSGEPLSGNGLTVVTGADALSGRTA